MRLWTATLYLLARCEVSYALLKQSITGNSDGGDLLPSRLIPSVAADDCGDRVLAEIDQDGFLFAMEKRDAQFFNTRDTFAQRRHHRVQIVLAKGAVCIRKSPVPHQGAGILALVREFVQLEFYLEAAALLRLRGLACVPTVRRIDPGRGIIEMDYIWGRDLRQVLEGGRGAIDYKEISRRFTALIAAPDGEISREVAELLTSVMDRGVIPRDIHAANFIRAGRSAKLYMVDFNLIYLRPVPGWRSHVRNLTWILGHPRGPGK